MIHGLRVSTSCHFTPMTSSFLINVQEWLPFGFPLCNILDDPGRHLQRTEGLASPLWCPVPELGPATAPGTHILEWEPGQEGRVLQLRTILLTAEVVSIRRQEVAQEIIPPKPKRITRKK